ncbi:MAG: CPBP family intramembrane metalloprotease [Candidatus Eremiobacteraeota bacterium]|nr:CPBP family intramembrane metalloprotease [Candidatus Eremiobacteraeota bacterium]
MAVALNLRARTPTIVGLIVALGWPLLFLVLPNQRHQNVTDMRQDEQIIAFEWIVTILVALIIIFWERLPLAHSVGLRRPVWRDALIALVALIVLAVTIAIVAFALHTRSAFSNVDPTKLRALPFALRFGIVFTAGFCEEFLFRGYAIERLIALTGKLWIGGVGAIVLFTVGHIARYGIGVELLGVAIIATFLTLIYIRRRSLWPCIVMHWVVDGLPLVVAPHFIRTHVV